MITRMNISQIDEVLDIWLQVNTIAHPFIDPMFWQQNKNEVKSMLPEAEVYVFQEKIKIKGFIGIINKQYIAGLFVITEEQSHGIGTALLQHCKRLYTSLSLDVFTKNTNAIQFYRKHGFHIQDKKFNTIFQEYEYHMIYDKERKY